MSAPRCPDCGGKMFPVSGGFFCAANHRAVYVFPDGYPPADPEPVERLRAKIKASGLSQAAYARTVLLREPRTVARWLKGGPIPKVVQTEHLGVKSP